MSDKIEVLMVENLAKFGKHFCVLPWVHFHAWPNKKVLPCCVADSSKPVSEIKDDESILEMMNSFEYKQIRKAMLNDEPMPHCKRCYDLECLNTTTMRMSHNKRRGKEYANYIAENTNPDGSLKNFEFKYMDIRFSNLCNMKCRSCGPECSSQWAQEYVENKGIDSYQTHFHTDKIVVSNNDDNTFLEKLKPYLKDVNETYFAGGEIIIAPEHYECLDYWIENKLTDQVELTYTTNFSTLRYKKDVDLIDYWKQFPKIKIWASLDAHGKTAEYLRKGTDWEKIVSNIKTLKQEAPHAEFQITPTISIWNIFTFPDFIDYMVEQDFINEYSQPRFNLATYPWFCNIMILPLNVKRNLIELYRGYVERYRDNPVMYNGFKAIVTNLTQGDENKEGILEFIKYNEQVDRYRNEKILDVIPQLKEVYEWASG